MMKYFRIFIYLKSLTFFLNCFFSSNTFNKKNIENNFNKITNKKYSLLTSQLRVGFVLVLKYLKKKYPQKNQIIISPYNLAEMINICENLKLKIVFPRLNNNIFISADDIKKKINKATLGVVATNIFNDHNDLIKIKNICKIKKVNLIEDNAIYYGNFYKKKTKSIYSGSFGDFSLHSFNIMKNISAMYGGLVSTNDQEFINYANLEIRKFKKFPLIKFLNQTIIYFILKIFAINVLYKTFFFRIIKLAHQKKLKFLYQAIYPSLKFKKKNHFKEYLYKVHPLSIKLIDAQLKDKKYFSKMHKKRMLNNQTYYKLFNRYKIKNLKTISLKNQSFQNFNEFPIIVQKKNQLVEHLFKNGIEVKVIQYVNCDQIFKKKYNNYSNQNIENKIVCLPNHYKISENYISYIVKTIANFYK